MKKSIKISLVLVSLLVFVFLGGYLAFNTEKKVEANWNEEDFASGVKKAQIKIKDIEEINLETLTRGNFSTQGSNHINDFFTSEEISALVSRANNTSGPIKDVKVSFGDDGRGELSFKLSDNFIDFLEEHNVLASLGTKIAKASDHEPGSTNNSSNRSVTDFVVNYITNIVNKKPVYATGELSRGSANSINIRIDKLTVGRVSMPKKVVDRVEQETVRIVNSIIKKENGFHIEELQVSDNKLYYKGTLPAEIEGEKLN